MLNPSIVYYNNRLGTYRETNEGYFFTDVVSFREEGPFPDRFNFKQTSENDQLTYLAKLCCGLDERVIEVHHIGQYQIVETEVINESSMSLQSGTHYFYICINFEFQHVCAPTLDSALTEAIAIKYDGRSSSAACYFRRMIGMSV